MTLTLVIKGKTAAAEADLFLTIDFISPPAIDLLEV
jgi:hypothetical protein